MKNKKNKLDSKRMKGIQRAAVDWTVRIDRGLTAEEQDQYTEWLPLDSEHLKAMAEYQQISEEFDRLAGLHALGWADVNPDLLAPENKLSRYLNGIPKSILWASAIPIAAVLLLAVSLLLNSQRPADIPVEPAVELMSRIEHRILPDGSTVRLNRGASLSVDFTPSERRIHLLKGEASFDVQKNPDRPFIVHARDMDVRVKGTIFNVNYLGRQMDVVVTEGQVEIIHRKPATHPAQPTREVQLNGGQMGKIRFSDTNDEPVIEVSLLSDADLEEINKWQPKLLDYDSTPLREIVREFNRRNPVQIILEDPALEEIQLSSSFWSDNVEGFVRLMVSSFGMQAEWRGSREIVLSAKSQ